MAKEENHEMAKVSPTMFNLRPHRLLQTSSTPAIQHQQKQQAHYSSAASSSGHGFYACAETEPARVDVLTASYEEQEYHRRTRRGGQNQRDEVAQQNREVSKKFPALVGGLGTLCSQRRPAPVHREVGLQRGDWWGFMEAVGKRHIIVFIWILWEDRDTISSWTLWRDSGIRWAEECFFISYHTTWSGMWEWISFSLRQFCTTNCMYPWPWMHPSYGLSTSSWSFLQLCWLTSQQWTLVWNSANKFEILLCKFPTIQVHWETCDIHVWQWMKHSVHRFRHCRKRWCPIVDVTSTNEKPWIPIRTYSREGLFVLCTYWYEKNDFAAAMRKMVSHSWFTRCCKVHEPSAFQDSHKDPLT